MKFRPKSKRLLIFLLISLYLMINAKGSTLVVIDSVLTTKTPIGLAKQYPGTIIESYEHFPFVIVNRESDQFSEFVAKEKPVKIIEQIDPLFLNIINSLDYCINYKKEHNISVINLSMSPRHYLDFDILDPVIIALKKCYEKGITLVVAAGNEGSYNTLNPWSLGDWAISVGGAVDEKKIWQESSIGLKNKAFYSPTVVAPIQSDLGEGKTGTSFSAAQVAALCAQIIKFYHILFENLLSEEKSNAAYINKFVKATLKRLALPIDGEKHEIGYGFVDQKAYKKFVQNYSFQDFTAIFGDTEVDKYKLDKAIKAAKKLFFEPEQPSRNLKIHNTVIIDFNTPYTRMYPPCIIPDINALDCGFNYPYPPVYKIDVYKRLSFFHHIPNLTNNNLAHITIDVEVKHRRKYTIDTSSVHKISNIIRKANYGDTILLRNGIYEWGYKLKSGLILLGEDNKLTVLKPLAKNIFALRIDEMKDVIISNLKIESSRENSYGIEIVNSQNILINNCSIHVGGNAISLRNAKSFMVSENCIYNGLNGVYSYKSKGYIVHNSIGGCKNACLSDVSEVHFINNAAIGNQFGLTNLESKIRAYNNIFNKNYAAGVLVSQNSKTLCGLNNFFGNAKFNYARGHFTNARQKDTGKFQLIITPLFASNKDTNTNSIKSPNIALLGSTSNEKWIFSTDYSFSDDELVELDEIDTTIHLGSDKCGLGYLKPEKTPPVFSQIYQFTLLGVSSYVEYLVCPPMNLNLISD